MARLQNRQLAAAFLWFTVGMLGCNGAEELEVERTSSALYYWVPQFHIPISVDLVGHGLNGVSLNGQAMDGHVVAGVSLEGVQMANGAPKTLKLKKTLFKGSHVAGKNGKNLGVIGSVFSAWLDDGTPIQLRIDDAYSADEYGGGWVWYVVSFAGESGWQPLCGVDESGAAIPAVPLNGLWNFQQGVPGGGAWTESDGHFTFACAGFALAKCVAMGYPPWAEGKLCDDEAKGKKCQKTTLASRHQACVRALRADYCGDGMSHTVDGVPINIYDGIGIRHERSDWSNEAEWDDNGALCIVKARLPEGAPACAEALASTICTAPDSFYGETLVVSQVEP